MTKKRPAEGPRLRRAITNQGGKEMKTFAAGAACLVLLLLSTAVYAPDAGPSERGGIEELVYRVLEDGRVMDNNGRQKGWIMGGDVYDNDWNLKLRIKGRDIQRAVDR
jgi:hypothetical protein